MKRLFRFARVLHGRIHDWIAKHYPKLSLRLQRIRNPHAAYLVLTPEHGNLGDHAIALSETQLLESLGIPYIEVTGKQLLDWQKNGWLHIMNGRPILVNGGGNLGTLWFHIEELLRQMIRENRRSPIFVLPSTIYYGEDPHDQAELERSVEIYNAHRRLKLYAREALSFEIMKKAYRDVSLVPDMALRLAKSEPGLVRKGCILCLRIDRERTRSEEEDSLIRDQAASVFGEDVRSLDMIAPRNVPVAKRNEALEKQFDAFRHAELVITDRLHGMIFCAITGTPCIVINSKSPKVRGCYDWIKQLPYIRFCEDVRDVTRIWQSIPKQDWKYDPSELLPLYEPLKDDILRFTKGKCYAERQRDRSHI